MEETREVGLHPAQMQVFKAKKRFLVLVAGRRFGKTYLAIIRLIINALSHEKANLWYVSPTYRQSKMIAWRLLKQLVPEGVAVQYNESELSAYFPATKSTVSLKGADNEDSLRGAGLGSPSMGWNVALVIDEFASIVDNWNVWHEVLRPMLADHRCGALFIGTPKGKDSFHELYLRGLRDDPEWNSFHFTSYDNPFIDAREIDEAKRTTPERYFKQEYLASFEDFQGLIYPEFSESLHVIEPTHILEAYKREAVIDPAISGTTASLSAAVDENGDIIIYDEYYEKNVRVSEVADVIKHKAYWLIDPASQARNTVKEGQLYSLFDEYQENGITCYPAENDVDAGINRTAEWFKTKRIKIFKTCTNLIWELERYHYTEAKETANGLTQVKPFKKDDHLCDCLRYLVMHRTSSSDLSQPQVIGFNSPAQKVKDWKAKQEQIRRGRR